MGQRIKIAFIQTYIIQTIFAISRAEGWPF